MRRAASLTLILIVAGLATAATASTTDLARDQGIGPEGGVAVVGGIPIGCQADGTDLIAYDVTVSGTSVSAHTKTVGIGTDLVCPSGVFARNGVLKVLVTVEDSVHNNMLSKIVFRAEQSGTTVWRCADVWTESGAFIKGASCYNGSRSRDYYWSVSGVLTQPTARLTAVATSDMAYEIQGEPVHIVDATSSLMVVQ